MDFEFNSLEELYDRLKPALITKKEEMKRLKYNYIKIEDIWNYLKEIKWKSARNLLLYQMVDDVMNADVVAIDNYLKSKLNEHNRTLYFEDDK